MSSNLTPIIISDNESEGEIDGEVPDSSDDGTLSDGESDEGDGNRLTFPPVGPAIGDEDVETDEEMGDMASSASAPVTGEDSAPEALPDDYALDGAQLRVPEIERLAYTMDHTSFSPPFSVSVNMPEPFSRAGLQNSEHFDHWLNHLRGRDVPEPPYADQLSGLDAAVYLALSVNVRREAENLALLRELLATNESELIELSRIDFLVARVATNPTMTALARAQGVEMTLPEWRRRQATVPQPPVTIRVGDYNYTRSPRTGDDDWSRTSLPDSHTRTGRPIRRELFVDPSGGPVRFDHPTDVKGEGFLERPSGKGKGPARDTRPQEFGEHGQAAPTAGTPATSVTSTRRRRGRSTSIDEVPPAKKLRE
ncbi:unnamed protein product [Peniophora sp. CBMAI 1063]|nr:unnamed protein product [Peniophora sp. CBMAI 1063]